MTRCPKCGRFAKDMGVRLVMALPTTWASGPTSRPNYIAGEIWETFTFTFATTGGYFCHFVLCSHCGEIDP